MSGSPETVACPRLVVGAPASGSGKTTVVAGLIAALVKRGQRVAPFKVGPDYIDPTYHTLAAGRPCRNLDPWMLASDYVPALVAHATRDADLALIEGVMGLFDGFSGVDDTGSTAHVARLLDAPVLLVVDVSAMARSAAALVQGFRDFDPRVRIGGVILNRIGSEGHARMVTEAVESSTGVPVLGYIPGDETLRLPERHLGLVPTLEPGHWRGWVEDVGTRVAVTVDLARIVELARGAPPLDLPSADPFVDASVSSSGGERQERARIAVAQDAAVNFTYPDNLDLLRAAGAEILPFSPLDDGALPEGSQGIYLSGGFPEVYADQLATNEPMKASIRAAHARGIPIYAECGGLMYLTEAIVDVSGTRYPMVGLLPGSSVMGSSLTIGYRTARAASDNWLWRRGDLVRGHEFHYSTWPDRPASLSPAYELLPTTANAAARVDGACVGSLIASYVHLHFLSSPGIAERFVAACSSGQPPLRR